MNNYIEKFKDKFGEELLYLNKLGAILNEKGKEFKINEVRNNLYVEDFLKIYSEKIIPLKGLSFILKGFYGKGERPMNDMDLLVMPDDFSMVEKEILKSGFITIGSEKKGWYEKSYVKNNILKIDLHKSLFYPYLYNVELEDFFKFRFKVDFNGRELNLLNDTMDLAVLILSIVNNSFNVSLLNLYDVIILVKKGNIDFNLLENVCKKWGIEKGVIFLNSLLYEIFDENFLNLNILNSKKVKKFFYSLGKVKERRGVMWRKWEFDYKFSMIRFKNVVKFSLFYFLKLKFR